MIDENALHGTGRRIENALEGITIQIKKKAETAGALNVYIYLIMDVQLNIRDHPVGQIGHVSTHCWNIGDTTNVDIFKVFLHTK